MTEVEIARQRYSRLLNRWVTDPPKNWAESWSLMQQINRAMYDLEQAEYREATAKENSHDKPHRL